MNAGCSFQRRAAHFLALSVRRLSAETTGTQPAHMPAFRPQFGNPRAHVRCTAYAPSILALPFRACDPRHTLILLTSPFGTQPEECTISRSMLHFRSTKFPVASPTIVLYCIPACPHCEVSSVFDGQKFFRSIQFIPILRALSMFSPGHRQKSDSSVGFVHAQDVSKPLPALVPGA